jgi:hypothetical protein
VGRDDVGSGTYASARLYPFEGFSHTENKLSDLVCERKKGRSEERERGTDANTCAEILLSL